MSLRRYYIVFNLLVLTIVIYCGVDIFYTLTDSKLSEIKIQQDTRQILNKMSAPRTSKSFDYYLSAIDRNLFGAAAEEQPTTPKQIKMEKLQPTTLNVSLLGTVSGDTENTTAVIQDKTKRSQELYKVGDTIQNATIVEILRRKVVLRLGDKNQILTMEENRSSSSPTRGKRQVQTRRAQPSTPVSRSTISLDTYEADKSLSDINKVLTQARVRPAYKDGKRDGLLLTNIRPNTIFTQLKLRNGDIIQSVDGDEIRRPEDIINFYDQLKSGYPVSLGIKRRGEEKVLNYIFE